MRSCWLTLFADVDLSKARGLDTIIHTGPSAVGVDTLIRSEGKIPSVFLRACGVPDRFIEYLPSLIRSMRPTQVPSCFICYSTKDEEFAKRLHARMVVTGRFKTSHLWALFKTSHDVMQIGDLRTTLQ